jgi:hypothetical protein
MITPFDLSESELARVAKILANRDAFIMLFELGNRDEPVSIAELCGKFKTEPSTIRDIVRVVVHLGFAFGSGSYSATPNGLAVINFIESSLKDDPFSHVPAQSNLTQSAIQALPGGSSTNNTVTGIFAAESSVAEDTTQSALTLTPLSSSEGEKFSSGDEARTNATPSHTRL